MVGMDVPLAWVAGGIIGRRAAGRRPDISLVFAGFGLGPAGLYFLCRWPAWDTHYLLGDDLPPAVVPLFSMALLGAALLAHLRGTSNRAIGAGLLVVLASILLAPGRMLHVGSWGEWSRGAAPLLPGEFLLALLLAGAWVVFWAVGCLIWAERVAWPPPVVAEEAARRDERERGAGGREIG